MDKLNISSTLISRCCKGQSKFAKEYIFRYKSDIEKGIFLEIPKDKKITRPIVQYTLDGQFLNEFNSIREASTLLNICNSKISLVAQGKRNQTGGYKWKYKSDIQNDTL